jgi:hypothetical protein
VGLFLLVGESNNHADCQSTLGRIGQAVDQGTATDCGSANTLYFVGIALLVLGVIGIGAVIAAAAFARPDDPASTGSGPQKRALWPYALVLALAALVVAALAFG